MPPQDPPFLKVERAMGVTRWRASPLLEALLQEDTASLKIQQFSWLRCGSDRTTAPVVRDEVDLTVEAMYP